MFICGPEVIKAATGESAQLEQFATADAHAAVSGNIHFIADDDTHAARLAQALIGYLPQNNLDDPPHRPTPTLSLEPPRSTRWCRPTRRCPSTCRPSSATSSTPAASSR
jgi:propionyl-CoA carboxylase beta chain